MDTSLFRIRPVTLDDAVALRTIYAPYILETAISYEYEVPSLADFTSRIEHIQKDLPYLVCESLVEGSIVGYAYASHHAVRAAYGWTVDLSIYLLPEFKRKGIGKQLYLTLLDILKQQGYVKAYAAISGDNPSSIDFHVHLGFTEVAVFKNIGYKFNRWHDLLWMEIPLNPQIGEMKKPDVCWRKGSFS